MKKPIPRIVSVVLVILLMGTLCSCGLTTKDTPNDIKKNISPNSALEGYWQKMVSGVAFDYKFQEGLFFIRFSSKVNGETVDTGYSYSGTYSINESNNFIILDNGEITVLRYSFDGMSITHLASVKQDGTDGAVFVKIGNLVETTPPPTPSSTKIVIDPNKPLVESFSSNNTEDQIGISFVGYEIKSYYINGAIRYEIENFVFHDFKGYLFLDFKNGKLISVIHTIYVTSPDTSLKLFKSAQIELNYTNNYYKSVFGVNPVLKTESKSNYEYRLSSISYGGNTIELKIAYSYYISHVSTDCCWFVVSKTFPVN